MGLPLCYCSGNSCFVSGWRESVNMHFIPPCYLFLPAVTVNWNGQQGLQVNTLVLCTIWNCYTRGFKLHFYHKNLFTVGCFLELFGFLMTALEFFL